MRRLSGVGDEVNPPYYRRWPIQPVEFITRNRLEFWLGNVIKYAMRFDQKDGLRDLRKARWYLDCKIRELKGKDRWWLGGDDG
jgi:hypothetical protein